VSDPGYRKSVRTLFTGYHAKATFRIITLFFLSAALLPGQEKQQITVIGDLKLENGKIIEDCFVGWRSFGRLNEDSSNVVLFPTWFGGVSAHLKNLCGPGQLIDSTRYYILALDALGNGISSSPSNSQTQKGPDFPLFTMRDMVRSQYLLLTEQLGFRKVFAVIGGSMGGMQTFNWIMEYPDYMEKAVPYVGSPRASASDWLSWTIQARMIDEGRKVGQADSVIVKNINLLQQMIVYTPEYRTRKTPHEEISSYIGGISNRLFSSYTLENFRWQLQAMMTNNIAKDHGNSLENAAKEISAEVLIIVNMQDHIVSPLPALELARAMKMHGKEIKTLALDNYYGHLGITPEMKKVSRTIHRFLRQ